ncbi:MAG: response regulator transcription factor [Kiritimatiellaeota bacterium]|nr:response regulator transcription factor [Kiritimatiellota bacterium]
MIVDDDRMLAELLTSVLDRKLEVCVVGHAAMAAEAVPLAKQTQPGLILLDIELPDGNGLDLIAPLQEALPDVKIVVLSSHFDPFTVYRVLRGGVQGYVEKPSPVSALVAALQRVLDGYTFFSPVFIGVKQQCLAAADAFHKILSEREQNILRLMAAGLSDEEIARHCELSQTTVVVHRKNMRDKLDVHSDRELLAYARRWGLSPTGPATPL